MQPTKAPPIDILEVWPTCNTKWTQHLSALEARGQRSSSCVQIQLSDTFNGI